MCVTWAIEYHQWFHTSSVSVRPERSDYGVCLIRLVSSAIWLYSERRSAIC
jgi:hypothetical protein